MGIVTADPGGAVPFDPGRLAGEPDPVAVAEPAWWRARSGGAALGQAPPAPDWAVVVRRERRGATGTAGAATADPGQPEPVVGLEPTT